MIVALALVCTVIPLVLGTILWQATPMAESRRWGRAQRRAAEQMRTIADQDFARDLAEEKESTP